MALPQNDTKFTFSYKFNDINQLVFSKNTEIGNLFINSAIAINPSIKTSSTQNVVNVKYTNVTNEVLVSSTINQISVARNIFVNNINSYSIVLHGNVLTSPGTNIYIFIPFGVARSNNKTNNSIAIEQIVKIASTQIQDNKAKTILDEPISLNNLIENNTNYTYSINPKFDTPSINNTIVLHKESSGVISNLYAPFLRQFITSSYNKINNSSSIFRNQFTPEVQQETSTSEIMIDCSPVEITTKDKNVMFSTLDDIYGTTTSATNETIVASFFLIILAFLSIYLLYKAIKIWSGVFLNDSDTPMSTPSRV